MENDFRQVYDELLSSKYDQKSTKDIASARQIDSAKGELVERSRKLNAFIDTYIEDHKSRRKHNTIMKWVMFGIFILLIVALTGIVGAICLKTNISSIEMSSAVALLSVLATYVGSIISIITIMCKYLFPINEEKFAIEMIKTVTDHDTEIWKY